MSDGTETPGGEAQPAVPAGWYPHPTAPGWEAYWTGTAWGAETRPAPAAAAAEPATAQQPAEPAAQPAAQEAAGTEQQSAPAAAPVAATGAAVGATGAAAAAPAAESRAGGRSESALPAILCVLGAVVAIAGTFLPEAKIDAPLDIEDNTMVAAGYGIAVIAAAVLGAAIAVWTYMKGARNWLPILLGVVIVGVAAYAGLVGVDDLEITGFTPPASLDGAGGQAPDAQALDALAQATQGANAEPDPSTGIFVVGAGGLLMLLGGLGLLRESR